MTFDGLQHGAEGLRHAYHEIDDAPISSAAVDG
jgi:hypothetical protein